MRFWAVVVCNEWWSRRRPRPGVNDSQRPHQQRDDERDDDDSDDNALGNAMIFIIELAVRGKLIHSGTRELMMRAKTLKTIINLELSKIIQ